MTKYAKQTAQAQHQQAAAARQIAWQNGQVAAAQSRLYQTQAQVLAGEAESRRVAALPRVCAHCRTPNPPGAVECATCGSVAFLPPAAGYLPPVGQPVRPSPPRKRNRAWAWFQKQPIGAQVAIAGAAAAVVLVVLVAVGSTSTPPAANTVAASDSTTAAVAALTVAPATVPVPAVPASTVAPLTVAPHPIGPDPFPAACAASKNDPTSPAGIQRLTTAVTASGSPVLQALMARATTAAVDGDLFSLASDFYNIEKQACAPGTVP